MTTIIIIDARGESLAIEIADHLFTPNQPPDMPCVADMLAHVTNDWQPVGELTIAYTANPLTSIEPPWPIPSKRWQGSPPRSAR